MQSIPSRPFHNEGAPKLIRHIGGAALRLVAVFCIFTVMAGCQERKRDANTDTQAMTVDIPDNSGLLQRTSESKTGLTTVMLSDKVLGIHASAVVVPAGWRAQGQMTTNPCTSLPSPSWNAVSPDGRSQLYVLPQFGWRWGNGAQYSHGCIPLSGPLQAVDFLQKFAARSGDLRILAAMPVADAFRHREENFTAHINGNNSRLLPQLRSRNTGDVAAVRAIDSKGYAMRLRAWVQCQERTQGGNCFARIDILRAPKGELGALVDLVDSHNLVQDRPTQEWQAAYMNHQQQVGAQQMDQLRRNEDAGNQALAQQRRNADASSQMLHQQYLDSSARLSAEHQAGMEQIQRSTDSSMRNANNSMNARSTSASDMEDYSLNQQTVSGANGTYKTSSQYSNVWSSPVGPALSDGRTFGSTDNTINPNTATDNTWSQDTKVHGNGQPY